MRTKTKQTTPFCKEKKSIYTKLFHILWYPVLCIYITVWLHFQVNVFIVLVTAVEKRDCLVLYNDTVEIFDQAVVFK